MSTIKAIKVSMRRGWIEADAVTDLRKGRMNGDDFFDLLQSIGWTPILAYEDGIYTPSWIL